MPDMHPIQSRLQSELGMVLSMSDAIIIFFMQCALEDPPGLSLQEQASFDRHTHSEQYGRGLSHLTLC